MRRDAAADSCRGGGCMQQGCRGDLSDFLGMWESGLLKKWEKSLLVCEVLGGLVGCRVFQKRTVFRLQFLLNLSLQTSTEKW